ncbi:hypothetical protein GPECTOR_41g654 [Gonium pectorale]|uniref:Uncharacterized protein n=1 Tax=Gonium pectorale TaxID=33097 RepID=A0A150GBF4_GONPE|nr:hypothetical protein GPECTOR_41g654 [Gonium pectorale]|eukprot:KXZ46690.1 hypothetical protein GPECTOR_41g654 [Gonium pectorale]
MLASDSGGSSTSNAGGDGSSGGGGVSGGGGRLVGDIAELDAQRFELHPSVRFWQSYRSPTLLSSPRQHGVLDRATRVSRPPLPTDPLGARFWAYHTARLSFFVGQAAAGTAAANVEALVSAWLLGTGAGGGAAGRLAAGPAAGSGGRDGGGGGGGGGGARRFGPAHPSGLAAAQQLTDDVGEVLATFEQDLENIRAGLYPLPWDMTTPQHRQYDPLFVLRQ